MAKCVTNPNWTYFMFYLKIVEFISARVENFLNRFEFVQNSNKNDPKFSSKFALKP